MQTNHTTSRSLARLPLIATALAALLLAACGRDDGRTAGEKVDAAIAKTEAKTEDIAKRVEAKLDNATTRAAAAVEDAKITAAVNAKLADDASLSALKINVDTTGGMVSLHGTAPDAISRDRATDLARAVEGVTGVDNKLEVRS